MSCCEGGCRFETSLISIVLKPIKIVVVVVVIVVIVKKKLGPKTFDPKTIHVEKTLGLKVLGQKKCCLNKCHCDI